ncbi:hypothetical protein Pelo_9134 [Pelomyxa schiedti]|nr:hypothetical protein Pelo_9134 [Pelomyxa schiedti]
MIKTLSCVLARDQAIALLACRQATQTTLKGSTGGATGGDLYKSLTAPMSVLPQCVLREFIKSWVLATSRQEVLVISLNKYGTDQSDSEYYDPATMYVLVSVTFTLGVTDGTPRVLQSFREQEPVARFLSPAVWLQSKWGLLTAVGLGRGESVLDSGLGHSVKCNRKWLVDYSGHALQMWRLDHSFFPQGEPLRLDVSGMETGKSFSLSLGLTHSQPVDCIADGDELCIVADKDCRCCLWIVDIQRCFDTRALAVAKELNVVREAKWGCDFCLTDILSDANRRLHVVLTNVRTPGVTTLIQDVATGRLTIHPATVSPVGDTHYGIMYYDQHEPLSHFSVFQTNWCGSGQQVPKGIIYGGMVFSSRRRAEVLHAVNHSQGITLLHSLCWT